MRFLPLLGGKVWRVSAALSQQVASR